MDKRCSKCGDYKCLDDFGKDKNKPDGKQAYCKQCKREYQKAYTPSKEAKDRYSVNRSLYYKTDRGKEVLRRNALKQDPYKKKARRIFCNAIRDNKIIRPGVCSVCNIECTPEGHHPDYSKPLDVVWVCKQCHTEIHMEV